MVIMADPTSKGPANSGVNDIKCEQVFVIDFGDENMKSKDGKKSLQESFLKFRKQRQVVVLKFLLFHKM